MSDSPPEKDVQWSEQGITSSYKFIQKLWNLNKKFLEEISKDHSKNHSDTLDKFTNKFLKKITINLESFHYNVIIANMHEMYSFLIKELEKKFDKKTLIENYTKILKTINPIIPHFSNECLETLNIKENFTCTVYNEKYFEETNVKIVVQINGKKRGLIETNKDTTEKSIVNQIINDEKLTKYVKNTKIKKQIYIKNKIINLIL